MQKVENYLYSPEDLFDVFNDVKAKFTQENPGLIFEKELPKITKRYLFSEQQAYLRFGVYYGAVLKVLQDMGIVPPSIENNEPYIIIEGYTVPEFENVSGQLLTLVAAFEFKDWYNANMLQGSNEFYPFGDEQEAYYLHDFDFEMYVTLSKLK